MKLLTMILRRIIILFFILCLHPQAYSHCEFVFKPLPENRKISEEILTLSDHDRVGASKPWGADVYSFHYKSDYYSETNVPPRTIYIWFPREYFTNPEKRFPVLYMHDGQQIWDDKHATKHGSWEVNLTAGRLIAERKIEPIIIVGISHLGKYRTDELSPPIWSFEKMYPYANLIEYEIKPLIDRSFRTKPDRKNLKGRLGTFLPFFCPKPQCLYTCNCKVWRKRSSQN